MPLFTGATFNSQLDALTVGLSQVLFPVVLLLGLTGLFVGDAAVLRPLHDPAIAPAVWNIVIIVLLVVLHPHFHGGYENGNSLYATRSGSSSRPSCSSRIVRGRTAPDRLPTARSPFDWRDPRIKQIFALMLPVTIGLGIVNLDQLINCGVRHAGQRRSAARDRKRVPHLHASPGAVLGRRRDGALPDAEPHGRAP